MASLCQTLPVVSSQDLASTSRVISVFDVQSHGPLEVVSHDLTVYIFCLHASVDVVVKGVGNDGQRCGVSHTPHILR